MYVIARSVTPESKAGINSKCLLNLWIMYNSLCLFAQKWMYKQKNKRRDKIAIEKRIKLCEQVKERNTENGRHACTWKVLSSNLLSPPRFTEK